MMENKCNKSPNKYLDHVYCQPGENKNYIRSNNNHAGGNGGNASSDLLALLKENKQLKAMLILHLDLIQEQSDQIVAKDKQLSELKEELQAEQAKNAQFEAQLQELQRQVQRQIKRAATAHQHGEIALLSPPPLAKIQCTKDVTSSSPTNIIGECNGKLISKIILQRSLPDGTLVESTLSPNSTTISDTTSEETLEHKQHNESDNFEENDESTDAIGSKPHQPTSKSTTPTITTISSTTSMALQVCVTPPTPSRGKQMPLMLSHAPNMHSEEDSVSCDSVADQILTPVGSPSHQTKVSTLDTPKRRSRSTQQSQSARSRQSRQRIQQQNRHKKRCSYLTAPKPYATREWENEDETVCDYEFSQAEADALYAEAPNLEIPKWTEHEISPLYCIEGTEDLSDESFFKRHAKLEVDERRRKKWDAQQIREQRRVEKLKKRHYKNELQNAEQQILKSFYPQTDDLQSICFVNELPVQAFGEMIPKLNLDHEFTLPWLKADPPADATIISTPSASTTKVTTPTTTANISASVEIMSNNANSSTSAQAQQQMVKSIFVFLKKRKRQQSSSTAGASRQRISAAVKLAAQQNANIAPASENPVPNIVETTATSDNPTKVEDEA